MDMKKINIMSYSNESGLINSILFLIFGILLFTNPGGILKFVSYLIGGILILIGTATILSYKKTLIKLNIEQKSKLITGIIFIILGLIAALFSSFIETSFRLICGGWIIYSGVVRLIEAISFKSDKITFIVSLIISILMISCGFYVALTTNLVFSMIGLFIIFYAIMEIINFIFYYKNNKLKIM